MEGRLLKEEGPRCALCDQSATHPLCEEHFEALHDQAVAAELAKPPSPSGPASLGAIVGAVGGVNKARREMARGEGSEASTCKIMPYGKVMIQREALEVVICRIVASIPM